MKYKKAILVKTIMAIALTLVSIGTAGWIHPSKIEAATHSVLRYGSTGSEVIYLQNLLNSKGFSVGKVDGIFGSITLNSVKNFQKSRGLVVDGVVGTQTWNALESSPTPSTYKFGSDSFTSSNPRGESIYLGQLGYANHEHFKRSTGGDDAYGSYFNRTGASKASYVYGYWFLSGIQMAPRGVSASTWGTQQAQLALKAYQDMKAVYGSKIRPVLFIDVDSASGGMKTYNYANNQAIYNAFVNYINKYGYGIKPGTYASPGDWQMMMNNVSPKTPGAYWVADYPGGNPTNLTTSNPYWVNFPGTKEKAEIWQYHGNGDYDVARILP